MRCCFLTGALLPPATFLSHGTVAWAQGLSARAWSSGGLPLASVCALVLASVTVRLYAAHGHGYRHPLAAVSPSEALRLRCDRMDGPPFR